MRCPCLLPDAAPTDLFQAIWTKTVQTAWKVNPAVAIQMTERFKPAHSEVTKLIRAHPDQVLHVSPEALQFLLGNGLDPGIRRSLKVSFPTLHQARCRSHSNSFCTFGILCLPSWPLRTFRRNMGVTL